MQVVFNLLGTNYLARLLINFTLIVAFCCHISASFMVFATIFTEATLESFELPKTEIFSLFVRGYFWAFQTIFLIGYGDLTLTNNF